MPYPPIPTSWILSHIKLKTFSISIPSGTRFLGKDIIKLQTTVDNKVLQIANYFRFISRYHYRRQNVTKTQNMFNMMMSVEKDLLPKSYFGMSRKEKDVFKNEWRNKSIEDCILSQDPECNMKNGSIWDSSFVRKSNVKHKRL